jgi:hypothetical protein
MNTSLLYRTDAWLIVGLLFMLMLVFNALGFKFRQHHLKKGVINEALNLGTIEGSLLGLIALFLAFTFNMAANRYDERRKVIVEEANDIGTAILRADLYPEPTRSKLRVDFKHYVEARIAYYQAGIDADKIETATKNTNFYSDRLWKQVTESAQKPENVLRSQMMVPAMNTMIDVVTTRAAIKDATVPESIIWLLFTLILSSAFVIGYCNAPHRMNRLLVIIFSIMIALTVFLILDLDRPSRGLINVEQSEQAIVALRKLF